VLRCHGTSLRGEHDTELSATFVCFPYLSTGERHHEMGSTNDEYPTRSILQVLYPYESTSSRDASPILGKGGSPSTEHVISMPQFWAVIVGSSKAQPYFSSHTLYTNRCVEFVVTCSELSSDEVLGSSITILQAPDHVESSSSTPTVDAGRNVAHEPYHTPEHGSNASPTGIQLQMPKQSMMVDTQPMTSSDSDAVRLFDGKRIEDFLANDSASDAAFNAAATAKLKQKIGRMSIQPFLSWAWLSSDFDESIPSQSLAIDNLFVIMQDVDRNLKRRDEVSYKHAYEASLDELNTDVRASGLRRDMPSPSGEDSIASPLRTATRLVLQSPLHSLRHSIGDLLAEDIILREQKSAIHEALHNLISKSEQFVGLFISRDYPHVVLRKIWGALLLLKRVSTIQTSFSNPFLCPTVSRGSPSA
jgi:hypothetical protein